MNQQPFITLVDQILAAKKQQPPSSPFSKGELSNADTSPLEKQIDPVRNPIAKHLALDSSEISNGVDEMVYALYCLTLEEIEIVEGDH